MITMKQGLITMQIDLANGSIYDIK